MKKDIVDALTELGYPVRRYNTDSGFATHFNYIEEKNGIRNQRKCTIEGVYYIEMTDDGQYMEEGQESGNVGMAYCVTPHEQQYFEKIGHDYVEEFKCRCLIGILVRLLAERMDADGTIKWHVYDKDGFRYIRCSVIAH